MVSRPLDSSLLSDRTSPAIQSNVLRGHSIDLRDGFRTGLIALIVAIAYYSGTKLGFALTPASEPIAAFWPPNAILLAALLLAPRRIWWILLLTVLPAHLVVQLKTGVPLATVVGWFIGNTGEALLGALCISYFSTKELLFQSVRGLLIFLGFGVILAPLVTSFVDAAVVVTTGWGNGYWMLWTTRLFSNMLAQLTLVPTIMLFVLNGASWLDEVRLSRWIEAGFLGISVAVVSVMAFGAHNVSPNSVPALLYAPLPILLWASVRFGSGGLSASLLTVALVSIWGAMHGRGPFRSASMGENLLALQVLLSAIAVPQLLLSAVMLERRATEKSLRETSGRLIDAQEQERQRVACELHDDIGQQLALVEIELGQLRDDTSVSSLRQRLERLHEQISRVSKTAREISHGLHPFQLEHLGLVSAIRRLCRDFDQGPLRIHFLETELPDELPAAISLCLYRVSQEALRNAATHSRAGTVTVSLKAQSGTLVLRIVDDGIGFSLPRNFHAGLGLASMGERLRAVGGSIEIKSAPATGTTVEATVPMPESPSLGASAVA